MILGSEGETAKNHEYHYRATYAQCPSKRFPPTTDRTPYIGSPGVTRDAVSTVVTIFLIDLYNLMLISGVHHMIQYFHVL